MLSCGYYFETLSSGQVDYICPNYSPIVVIKRYSPNGKAFLCLVRLPYVVFRFYCKEENNVVYGSREWFPKKIAANRDMQAVSHNCNWPNGVVSGVHVVTTPYMRYWSLYCSTVARN